MTLLVAALLVASVTAEIPKRAVRCHSAPLSSGWCREY